MKATLQDLLAAGGPILADGAMGTLLTAQGLPAGSPPPLWNVERPEAVRAVHRAYIEAGSQIILTNSFVASRVLLGRYGLGERAAELNEAAARLARAEADAADRPVVVAGSIGPTGEMLEPLGTLSFEDAKAAFAEQAGALAAGAPATGGVDVFWIETMSDLEEVRAAVEGCRQAAPGLPLVTTMTFDTGGRTMMGVTPERALETMSGLGAMALGANCGNGPDEIEDVIRKMHAANPGATLVAKANAGRPRLENGVAVFDATPPVMAGYAARMRALGATIIGGCCGNTPDHIRAMARALREG